MPQRKTPSAYEIAVGFRNGLLVDQSSEFMCMAVCLPLHGYLEFMGHKTTLIHGWADCGDYDMDHVWLQLEDGRILDPTADQFPPMKDGTKLPPVYVGPKPDWYYENV